MIHSKRICITGGTGFIGSVLTKKLLDNNTVVILDNLSRDALHHIDYADSPNFTLIKGDVRDFDTVMQAVRGADYVIHCAGITGIDTVVIKPTETLSVNMIGSYNVLEAARRDGNVKRVICFSTSEVFGGMAFASKETDRTVIGAVGEARWTYAVSKLAEEHLAIAYYKEHGVPAIVLRPFNVYGPGQVGEGALRIFIERALKNETLIVTGDGTQIRAWCYVDDMTDSVLLCLENDAAIGESFNIGNDKSTQTIYGLANTVIRVLKSNSTIEFTPAPSADIELRIPCVTKAREILGFEAKVDLEDGILRTASCGQPIITAAMTDKVISTLCTAWPFMRKGAASPAPFAGPWRQYVVPFFRTLFPSSCKGGLLKWSIDRA